MKILYFFSKHKWIFIWILYLILIGGYISTIIVCNDKDWCSIFAQTGGIFVTVLLMLIIMVKNSEDITANTRLEISHIIEMNESLKENTEKSIRSIEANTKEQINTLKSTSEKQIENFVLQTNGIINSLEKSIQVMVQMSEKYDEMLKHEKEGNKRIDKKWEKILEDKEKLYKGFRDETLKNKPAIFIRIQKQDYWIFWERYYLYIRSAGGVAKSILINCKFCNNQNNHNSISFDINELTKNDTPSKLDCGNVNNYPDLDIVLVEIVMRDINNNEYIGRIDSFVNNEDWKEVKLSFRSDLAIDTDTIEIE